VKFLIDTNVLIPLEPTRESDYELGTQPAVDLCRLVSEMGHQLYVHPAGLLDIRRDKDVQRRRLRERLFGKYPQLPSPPAVPPSLESFLGHADPGENDWVDNHLVAALHADAADYLVTDDRDIHRKAATLGLMMKERVLTIAEALCVVQDLSDKTPAAPPAMRWIYCHELNGRDAFFDSFRADYGGFDAWFRKCKREHRKVAVVEKAASQMAAACIIKPKEHRTNGGREKHLKLCSFKVAPTFNGFRFGELLLKAVFEFAAENRYDWLYTTVLPKHVGLVSLLRDFGFQDSGERTPHGDMVLRKPMLFSEKDRSSMDALEFNVRFGPSAVKIRDVPSFLVPIKPVYHARLFPEAERQQQLLAGEDPCGNSIRKAYISNSRITRIRPGASLFFYRSGDLHGVRAVGVVEDAISSSNPEAVARYVGKRTVYRFHEIQQICSKKALAILFRQSLFLRHPISLGELKTNRVVAGPPQTITEIPGEVKEWLERRLRE
jgi:L-amino acid N-acyltransferase YncA